MMQNQFTGKPASEINATIENFPKAEIREISVKDATNERFEAVVVGNEVVSCVSPRYVLIQHREAFRPITEGITLLGKDKFEFTAWANPTRAALNIFVGEGYDTVRYGFRVLNSFDGKSALRYSFSSFKRTKVIEIVGYRKVCSNGMIARVPLDQAEFVKKEEREQIEGLLSKQLRITHTGDAHEKVAAMQYIVEAMLLLEKPLQRMIKAAQKFPVDPKKAEEFIRKYVGKRMAERVLNRFKTDTETEGATLWGLYNAATFVASHEQLAQSTKGSLLNKAATMLQEELAPKAEVV